MNYFELFGLPVAPVVDTSLLAKKYFELQRQSHPDFFTQSTEHEREESLALSANINKAFNIFKNEDKTLEYFLETVGALSPNEKYELPPDFLMEMMDINEEIGEGIAVDEKLEGFTTNLKNEVTGLLKHDRRQPLEPSELARLKGYFFKKKYLKRILDRLGD